MKKTIIASVLALVLPSLVLAAFNPATLTNGLDRVAVYTKAQADKLFGEGYVLETSAPSRELGAIPGDVVTNQIYFTKGAIIGGGVISLTATSGQETAALTEYQVKNFSQIDYTPGDAAVTLSSPASSTFARILPRVGDSKTIYFRNLDATAATTTTIAAGAGVDLRMSEATGQDVVINGSNNAVLTFRRVASNVIELSVDEEVVAD